MSELPERKVLKNLLVDLKSRTLSSEDEFKNKQSDFLNGLAEMVAKLKDLGDKHQVEGANSFILLISIIASSFNQLAETVRRSHDDMRLYIKALEQYSVELDKTLTEIFEQAKKQAEEQIEQEEALRKRTSPNFYTA
jgi:hypothetical protein